MDIRAVAEPDKLAYQDLLLLADEQMDMVERYLHRGEMVALWDQGEVKSICVVTQEGDGVYELKNMATRPSCQRQGYGKRLIQFLLEHYRGKGTVLYVGTGDSPQTLGFYQSCGFVPSHVVPRFFTDHYDHPIFENGVQLVDMIYLKAYL